MALPVTIPNTFANATSSIPLSQLDTNFSTLANAVNGLNSGSETLANLKATTANVGVLTVTGNATIGDASTDTVTLNSTLTANTAVIFAAGTSAAPSITTTGDPNTGIFFPAADTIAFTEGGAEAMRIDSSGNVGIGTASPLKRLDVRVDSGSGSGGAYISRNNTINLIANIDGTTSAQFGTETNHPLLFLTNNTEKMRIDTNGRVGIGATPASWNTGWKVQQIGVGSFADALSSGAGNIIISSNYYDDGTNSRYINTGAASLYQSYNGAHVFYTAPSGSAGAGMSPTVRARINEYGIGVGDTTPSSGMGITFPATISASSNANTLDDYEEGTWTVTVTGGTTAGTTTYGVQDGWYRKIGSQVTVWYYVSVNSATGTGPLRIGVLPFTLNSTNIQSTGSIMTDNLNWDVTTATIVSYAGTAGQYLNIYLSSDNAGWQQQQMVNEQFYLIGTHTYFTND